MTKFIAARDKICFAENKTKPNATIEHLGLKFERHEGSFYKKNKNKATFHDKKNFVTYFIVIDGGLRLEAFSCIVEQEQEYLERLKRRDYTDIINFLMSAIFYLTKD